MKFIIDPISKKRKYILGMYLLDQKNNYNEPIHSKGLFALAIIFISLFVLSILATAFLFGTAVYTKVNHHIKNAETYGDRAVSLGVVIPSIKRDSMQEIAAESKQVASGGKALEEVKPRLFIWLPFYLLIPILLISTTFHEAGHYIMCRRAGIKVKSYGLGVLYLFYIPLPLMVAYVEPKKGDFNKTSKFNFFSVISAGCSMNLVLVTLAVILSFWIQNYFIYLLFIINLGLATTNSLPLYPLDGGQIFKRISNKLNMILTSLSILCLVALII